MKYITFKFLYERLNIYLKKENTHVRIIVLVYEKVAMSLHRLGSGDILQNIGDLFRVQNNTLSKTVLEFCRAIRKHLQLVLLQTSSEL